MLKALKLFNLLFCFSTLVNCGGNKTPPDANTEPTINPTSSTLPDRILCDHTEMGYQLILVFKDEVLPEGVSAIGLKNNSEVIFKVATQLFTESSDPNTIHFSQIPATSDSIEVKLNLTDKTARLFNHNVETLEEGETFNCKF